MLKLLNFVNNIFDHPDFGRFILRLTLGVLLLFHGWFKLVNGVGWIEGMIVAKGLPSFLAYGVFIGELVAPILVILGVFTRIGAILIAGNMVVAWLLVDIKNTFTLTSVGALGIELQILFFALALAVVFFGAGKFSVAAGTKWN